MTDTTLKALRNVVADNKEASYQAGREAGLREAADLIKTRMGNSYLFDAILAMYLSDAILALIDQPAPAVTVQEAARDDLVAVRVPRRLVPEVMQWLEDEIPPWPDDTGYQRDLQDGLAALRALATGDDHE